MMFSFSIISLVTFSSRCLTSRSLASSLLSNFLFVPCSCLFSI
jgi:hypothetical protein